MPCYYSLTTAVLLSFSFSFLATAPTQAQTTITLPPPPLAPPAPPAPAPAPAPPAPPAPPTGPYNPTPLYSFHSVFIDGKTLFVHGGIPGPSSPISKQTFSLDLSTSWKTSQPAFKQLTGGFPSSGSTSALLNDRRTWVLFYGQQSVLYDTQLNDWGGPKNINEMNPIAGFPAVTDFTTNQVYIVNGWIEPTMTITIPIAGDPGGGTGGGVSPDVIPSISTPPLMMRYDGVTGEVASLGAGSKFEIVQDGFAGCWSSLRNSFFLHGGIVGYPVVYQKTLYEFIPSNPKYTTISDTGAAPSARFGHCLVEAYGGTKMVLFGGQGQSNAVLSDIYILDVEKMSWKAGKVGGAGVGRSHAACAVSNDMFVAWGGATRVGNNPAALTSNLTVVYNLKTGEWQSTFSPARVGSTPNPSSTNSGVIRPSIGVEGEIKDGSSSSGALVGGILGGIVAIGAIAGLLFFRRSRAVRNKKQKQGKQMSLSTYSALPVVATRKASSSDDSLPRESISHGKEEKGDNDNDDGGGVVYAVELPATSSSVTPRDLFAGYQQQQQQQQRQQQQQQQQREQQQQQHVLHHHGSRIHILDPVSTAAAAVVAASVTSAYTPPIIARPYMPEDHIVKIFEPSTPFASPLPLLPPRPPIAAPRRPQSIPPDHIYNQRQQQQQQQQQGEILLCLYRPPPPSVIYDPTASPIASTASPTASTASTIATGGGGVSIAYVPGSSNSLPWVNTCVPSVSSVVASPSTSTTTPLLSPSPSEIEPRASVQSFSFVGSGSGGNVGKAEVESIPRNPQGAGQV